MGKKKKKKNAILRAEGLRVSYMYNVDGQQTNKEKTKYICELKNKKQKKINIIIILPPSLYINRDTIITKFYKLQEAFFLLLKKVFYTNEGFIK